MDRREFLLFTIFAGVILMDVKSTNERKKATENTRTSTKTEYYPQFSPIEAIAEGIPTAGVFSVSKTSPHIGLQLSESGDMVISPIGHGQNSIFVVAGLEGKIAFTHESEPGVWLTNNANQLAYMASHDGVPVVISLSEGDKKVIDNAAFPALWNHLLAYSCADFGRLPIRYSTIISNLSDGNMGGSIGFNLMMPVFSSDGGQLAYFLRDESPHFSGYRNPIWKIYCENVHNQLSSHPGPNIMRKIGFPMIGNMMTQSLEPVVYHGHDSILFQTIMPGCENPEIYSIRAVDEQLTRLTKSKKTKLFPQMTDDGTTVFYLVPTGKDFQLYCTIRDPLRDDSFRELNLRIRTPYFQLHSGNMLYIGGNDLYSAKISDVLAGNSKRENVTSVIRASLGLKR